MAISSGERGTASQQQDRRNAADHAAGSSMGGRGTMGQQQDRRNTAAAQRAGNAAPGVGRSFSPGDRATNSPYGGMPSFQPRRSVNPTPSYDMTLGNLAKVGMMLGGAAIGGSPLTAMGMMGRPLGSALGPGIGAMMGFDGYRGAVNGPGDYDGPNRFATLGSSLFPGAPAASPGMGMPGAAGAARPNPMNPTMQGLTMPGQYLSVGGAGLPSYGAQVPGFNFYGPQGGGGVPPAVPRAPTMPRPMGLR